VSTGLRRRVPTLVMMLLAALLTGRAGEAAGGDGVCRLLTVPPGFLARCERSSLGMRLVVRDPGAAHPLERLTLRELERRGDDLLAWTDPRRWLERQLMLDTRGLARALDRLRREAGDPTVATLLRGLARLLERLGGLALGACDHRRSLVGQRVLSCRFGRDPLELFVQVRLIEAGDRRFAVNITALDHRRLRRLEAVANGFRGTAS